MKTRDDGATVVRFFEPSVFVKYSAVGSGGLLLEDFEAKQGFDKQAFILEAIESVGGSKAEAARRLGITPQHLQYILGESKSAKTIKLKSEEVIV